MVGHGWKVVHIKRSKEQVQAKRVKAQLHDPLLLGPVAAHRCVIGLWQVAAA